MITKWKVFNFKSIREETELELGPLTIFAGANSSGKSTFIQSILLVAQTLAYKVSSRSVVLNGTLASLGQFDDLKSNGSPANQITVKFTCKPFSESEQHAENIPVIVNNSAYFGVSDNHFQEVSCEISFDADPSSPQRDLYQIQPRLFASHLSCTSRDEDNVDDVASITIRRASADRFTDNGIKYVNEIDDALREGLAFEVDLDAKSLAEVHADYITAVPVGCFLRHFLPERVIFAVDTLQETAYTITRFLREDARRNYGLIRRGLVRETLLTEQILSVLRNILGGIIDFDMVFDQNNENPFLEGIISEPLTLRGWQERLRRQPYRVRSAVQMMLCECANLCDQIYQALISTDLPVEETHNFVRNIPPRQLSEAVGFLEEYFSSSLKYLGPLRDAPKPLYPLSPAADPFDVGLRGEHTASLLELHKGRKIRYIPSTNFTTPILDRKLVTRTLEVAVIDWLQYLGVANSVKTRDQGKLGHELKVGLAKSDYAHDLTHVGVGVSQVLPILVMCLLADSDTTLVFEQPELHLHPKVQTLLGDFFLSMALCKKQCLVETHSEYLIDRLRFRIASNPSDYLLNKLAKIYFVEKPDESSTFREVIVNEFGAIQEWPEGFFDQSQRQAEHILLAASLKRKANRRKSDV